MKVIERYILGRAFLLFLAVFSATLAVVWVTQALARINLITTNGQSLATFLEIATLILPTMIPEVLPFAVAVAVAQTLVAMNTDSELAVISAAGMPRKAVIRPMIVLALLVSVLSFAVTNVLDPYARLKYRKLISAARADLIAVALQEDTFTQIEGGLFIQIGERLPGGDLASVFVADSRERDVDLVYYARQGSLIEKDEKRLLLMRDGEIQRETPDGDVSVIRFEAYAFDLSPFSPSTRLMLRPRDQTLSFLLAPTPTDPLVREVPGEFRAELHRRLAEWSYPLLFALIGLAAAGDARSYREKRVSPLLIALVVALLIRWLAFIAVAATEVSAPFIAMIYAVPLSAAAIAVWFLATNRTLELPAALLNRLQSMFAGMRERIGGRAWPDRKRLSWSD